MIANASGAFALPRPAVRSELTNTEPLASDGCCDATRLPPYRCGPLRSDNFARARRSQIIALALEAGLAWAPRPISGAQA